jgi:PIN domain nuclease of toxin-antitoxin system
VSRLLLDTHVLLWWDSGSRSLGRGARTAIENATEVFVSAASEWELAIKVGSTGRQLRRSVLEAVAAAGFEPLPITFQHVQAVRTLERIHKDPFDRVLVAVALTDGLTLVSADAMLARYPVPLIDAAE